MKEELLLTANVVAGHMSLDLLSKEILLYDIENVRNVELLSKLERCQTEIGYTKK